MVLSMHRYIRSEFLNLVCAHRNTWVSRLEDVSSFMTPTFFFFFLLTMHFLAVKYICPLFIPVLHKAFHVCAQAHAIKPTICCTKNSQQTIGTFATTASSHSNNVPVSLYPVQPSSSWWSNVTRCSDLQMWNFAASVIVRVGTNWRQKNCSVPHFLFCL